MILSFLPLLFLPTGASFIDSSHPMEWTTQSTSHFGVYVQSTNAVCRERLDQLETIRSFLLTTPWASGAVAARNRLVIFRDQTAFIPYRSNPAAAAYYKTVRGIDYIAMPLADFCSTRAAIHEYIHSVFSEIAPDMPLWLAEGLAEVYSSVYVKDQQLAIGASINEHLDRLLQRKPEDFSIALSMVESSPRYALPESMAQFYALSWAAVRMMLRTPQYAHDFPEFLLQVSQSSTAKALLTVYGKSVSNFKEDIDRDIQLANNSFLATAPMITETHSSQRDLRSAELLCILSDLSIPGSLEEADLRSQLSEFLIHSSRSQDSEVRISLAFLLLRQHDINEAFTLLRVASYDASVDDDTESILTLLELNVRTQSNEDVTETLVRKAIRLPLFKDSERLRLAEVCVITKRYKLAASLLMQVQNNIYQQRFDFLYTVAYCFLKTRDFPLCRDFGLRALVSARDMEQSRKAGGLLRTLDHLASEQSGASKRSCLEHVSPGQKTETTCPAREDETGKIIR